MFFADHLVIVKPSNSLCNRPWSYKTTIQLWLFLSKLLQLWNFSTLNDVQYTVVHDRGRPIKPLIEYNYYIKHATWGNIIFLYDENLNFSIFFCLRSSIITKWFLSRSAVWFFSNLFSQEATQAWYNAYPLSELPLWHLTWQWHYAKTTQPSFKSFMNYI